jgi:hypothetical protein
MTTAICPSCHGNGHFSAFVDSEGHSGVTYITCQRCAGSGEIDMRREVWMTVGGTHRTWRVCQHEGLAACAERLGVDDIDLQDMERGIKDPTMLVEHIPEILRPKVALVEIPPVRRALE